MEFNITQEELDRAKEDLKPKPEITQEQKENTPEGKCPACYWKCRHTKPYHCVYKM